MCCIVVSLVLDGSVELMGDIQGAVDGSVELMD
jgi:hypothetical protein